MELINELELRTILKRKYSPSDLIERILKRIADPNLPWEEKRSFWHFLYLSNNKNTLGQAIEECLRRKESVPMELVIQLISETGKQPKPVVFEAIIKGLKKLRMHESVFAARGLDRWDARLATIRNELIEQKVQAQRKFKDDLIERFWFLRNQRILDQAGRVLRRLIELFPDDRSLKTLKNEFEEQRAREVLSDHVSTAYQAKLEKTKTSPSSADEEMLNCFFKFGEELILETRELASDIAMIFIFMEDYSRALDVLSWAPASVTKDWLTCEIFLASRRFLEALELLNQLEVKYIAEPETTFAVNYLRAQCLHGLGQSSTALEILQSIVRIRPTYRSAHALILEWTEGARWD